MAIKRNKFFILVYFLGLLLFMNLSVFAQLSKVEPRKMFMEAESYMLFEEYPDALSLYVRLSNLYPENNNYNYKIGLCYLNLPTEKAKAVPYLEKAIRSTDPAFKEGNFKETKAPLEAYYYLGVAYRINNQLSKAIAAFKKFQRISNAKVYDEVLVSDEIKACETAMELRKKPVYFLETNLGNLINTRFSETNAVISGDESVLVFSRHLQFYDAIFCSRKVNGEWSDPVNLVPELGVDDKCYPTGLSYDGTELYIYRLDDYKGNIYVSTYSNGRWSKLVKLNENINTKYWESHASLSKDGKTLYFTSNRRGGYGGLDIYVSHRTKKYDWGPPTNLGPVINSAYNEDSPFISEDNKTLYFSSYGHDNMGGYDIFYSNWINGQWTTPVNMGYPINTTDDDLFFMPVKNGIYAYYSKYSGKGYGLKDIYRLEIFSDRHPRKIKIRGLVSLADKSAVAGKNIVIRIIDLQTHDTVGLLSPDTGGDYDFSAIPGNYDVQISGDGIQGLQQKLVVPKNITESELKISSVLSPSERTAEKISVSAIPSVQITPLELPLKSYDFTGKGPFKIDLKLKKNSKLVIDTYADSVLINSQTFDIKKNRFTYQFVPLEGKSILKLKLTDEDGNVQLGEITVNYKPEKAEVKEISTAPASGNMNTLVNTLVPYAKGGLKELLQHLDLKKENINNEAALIQYLKKEAESGHYSEQDILNMLTAYSANLSLHEFLNQLLIHSHGSLHNFLMTINPEALHLTNPEQLIHYLKTHAASQGYSYDDLISLLSEIASQGFSDVSDFRNALAKVSSPNLKAYLLSLPLGPENIKTVPQLIKNLLDHIPGKGFTRDDLISALQKLAMQNVINSYRIKMARLSSGQLSAALKNLDLSKENIFQFTDLIRWLDQNAGKLYSRDDLMETLLKLANFEKTNQQAVRSSGATQGTKFSMPYAVGIGGLFILLLILIALWRKKRKDKKA